MPTKSTPTATPAAIRAEDVFSAEYLAYARAANRLGFIFDPRNRFNEGQPLQAAEAFTRAADAGDASVLSNYGVRMLRKGLAGDWMVVHIEDEHRYLKFRADMPSMEVVRAQRLQPQWAQSIVLDVEATMQVLSAGARRFTVSVIDDSGAPVAGAKVMIIFDSVRKLGAEVRTNPGGQATLAVPASWQRRTSPQSSPTKSDVRHLIADRARATGRTAQSSIRPWHPAPAHRSAPLTRISDDVPFPDATFVTRKALRAPLRKQLERLSKRHGRRAGRRIEDRLGNLAHGGHCHCQSIPKPAGDHGPSDQQKARREGALEKRRAIADGPAFRRGRFPVRRQPRGAAI